MGDDQLQPELADTDGWGAYLGGFYTAARVASVLGGRDGQVTEREIRERRDLLALQTTSGQVVYPRFQFRDGRPLPGLAEVLEALPPELVSRWTVASWLVSGRISGHDDPPVQLLAAGNVAPVVAAAREWARALAQ